MPANVESMFYTGAKPWHGLGEKLEDAPTISEAIEKMEAQLAEYRGHQAEMLEGIREMREILGLGEEGEEPVLQLVTDEE